jgi:pimeloyl-ACP methyl ester carboxylesterase
MSFRDVVVLLPGITGSVLANDKDQELWSPSAGSVWRVITSVGGSIKGLELDNGGDPGGVTATRLIPDITIVPRFMKIEGYTRIEKYLIAQLGLERGKNYFPFPYDWRLDNRVNAKRLESQAMTWLNDWRERHGGPRDASLILVGHSMGGLVSRYFLECLGGWAHTRTLITLGTPHRGSLNAVDFLVNGMKKGVGPFGLDLSPLLRSYPSVYQLLPIYPCIDSGRGEMVRVAAAAEAGALPQVNVKWAADARQFHTEIEEAQTANAKTSAYLERGYKLIPVVGIEQPTYQSVKTSMGNIELLRSYNGKDMGGDGTVPRVSGTPLELSTDEREIYAAEMHGSLQNADGALANLKGVLTRPDIDLGRFRVELPISLTLDLDDVVLAGEPLTVRVRASEGNPPVTARLTHMATKTEVLEVLGRSRHAGWQESELDLEPGVWKVRVEAEGASPVTDLAVVASTS